MAHLEDALRPASVLQSDLSLSRVPLRSPSQERPGFSLSPARLLIPLGHGPLEYPYKDRWFSPSSPGGPFLTRGPDRRWRGRCPRSGSLHDRLVLPIPRRSYLVYARARSFSYMDLFLCGPLAPY